MRQMTRGPQAVARWSAHNPWRAIGLWLALVVVAVALSALIPTQQTDDADYRVGQSGTADQMIHDAGLAAPDSEFVLITGDQDDAVAAAAELRGYLAGSTGGAGDLVARTVAGRFGAIGLDLPARAAGRRRTDHRRHQRGGGVGRHRTSGPAVRADR